MQCPEHTVCICVNQHFSQKHLLNKLWINSIISLKILCGGYYANENSSNCSKGTKKRKKERKNKIGILILY